MSSSRLIKNCLSALVVAAALAGCRGGSGSGGMGVLLDPPYCRR